MIESIGFVIQAPYKNSFCPSVFSRPCATSRVFNMWSADLWGFAARWQGVPEQADKNYKSDLLQRRTYRPHFMFCYVSER